MQKRNVLNSPRLSELKRHRRRSFLNKILFFLLGVLVVFIFLVYLSRLNNLNISNIEVTGNQVIDTNAIKGVVEQETAGKYLWLFPKTNIFFYPENAIKNELQNKFKRLENINLSIKNDKTLAVSVGERKALYIWCGSIPPIVAAITDNSQNCYFVDENGYIFDQAPYFSGDIYFKFYGLPDSVSPTLEGETFNPSGFYFSQQNFKQLISFRDTLVSLDLKPTSLYVTSDGEVEVSLSNGNSSTVPPEIMFNLSDNYEKVAENLEAAITTEPLQSEFKNKYSSLLYIDLRFGNKVYYKFDSTPVATK
jgi:cell division septal protein FtsQ